MTTMDVPLGVNLIKSHGNDSPMIENIISVLSIYGAEI